MGIGNLFSQFFPALIKFGRENYLLTFPAFQKRQETFHKYKSSTDFLIGWLGNVDIDCSFGNGMWLISARNGLNYY